MQGNSFITLWEVQLCRVTTERDCNDDDAGVHKCNIVVSTQGLIERETIH